MDNGVGWLVLLAVVFWAGHQIYKGYRRETAPPLATADNGHGLRVPVCAKCQTELVTLSRSTHSVVAGVLAWSAVLLGLAVLVLVNWLAGLLLILVGVVINAAGKGQRTVLTCPACGTDARDLD